eukprot:SAG22_NODE_258_length_13522_cov_6.989496_14_plen_92_part_00
MQQTQDPTSLPAKLGAAAPQHSNFYVAYILMNGPGYRIPVQLLRLPELGSLAAGWVWRTRCGTAMGVAGGGWRTEREQQADLAPKVCPYEE